MRRTWVWGFVAAGVLFATGAWAQGGQAGGFGGGGGGFGGGQVGGGGGFGGGAAQAGGGQQQENYDRSVREIESRIQRYLDGNEVKNILTPGEFSEWPLTMKAGQVMIAEARSDAFDPALEIVDKDAKVLATNDDRYPGDQRPLLLWRCEKDGEYSIRGRCFHDKAGGQFFLRMKIYESMDLNMDKPVERSFDKPTKFLVRIPIKAGQVVQPYNDITDWQKFQPVDFQATISPIGLPDINLAAPIRSIVSNAIMAPVDGDYYVLTDSYHGAPISSRIGVRTVSPVKLAVENGTASSKAKTMSATLWAMSVKAGQVLEASTPELYVHSMMALTEEPDVSKYDMKKPETNPFFPVVKKSGEEDVVEVPALTMLPGRLRDQRISVFVAQRDAKIWIATAGYGKENTQYTMNVRPAAREFGDTKETGSKLRIGNTDYWAFDAKVGDVMTFKFGATGFSERIVVRDPHLLEILSNEAAPDQTSLDGSLIARIPGRYLVAMSSYGDGGGGDYTLLRQVFHAKEFKKGSDAKGNFTNGDTQVWKFTAKPDEPLLIHWTSSEWSYSIAVRDSEGNEVRLPMMAVDRNNQFGILKVAKPTEFMIVLIPNGSKASYSIELTDLPGYGKGK